MNKKNVDVSFTNIEGSNYKGKNDENVMTEIEPRTTLGFISLNRHADVSDLMYQRDSMANDRNIEEMMRLQEEIELAKFRESSIYRPSIQQPKNGTGGLHLSKREKEESQNFTSKIVLKPKKKRKISEDLIIDKKIESNSVLANISQSNTDNTDLKPKELSKEISKEISEEVSGNAANALSMLGSYDDEDSD
jgi:hypothetical protein